MIKISTFALLAMVLAFMAVPAFATASVEVPEPSSLMLLAYAIGGIGGVAVLRSMRKL